ncbi:MAG: hypothetical protein QNL60_09725 [Flavobacteriales bacterium]|jgi:hypothetical protein
MHPILRNVLAVLVGIIVGGVFNMALLSVGMSVFPLPESVDINNVVSMSEGMKSGAFETKHYLVPFFAHAFGTLVGAFLTAKLCAHSHFILAMVIGAWFLVGGTIMAWVLPSPIWLIILDLSVAYLPMAWLGWKFAGAKKEV